jgi:DNA topoisomerase-1
LALIVRRCQDIPGCELFQYVDDAGDDHTIDSADVNEYLRDIRNEDFTAKNFCTWAGTVLTCVILRKLEAFQSETEAKKNIASDQGGRRAPRLLLKHATTKTYFNQVVP